MFFTQIKGNDNQKEYLNNVILRGNISHSYMFVGTMGIGKKLIATEFARKLLCLELGQDSCNCKSCVCFNGGNNPDYMIVNEDGQTIKIDTIRLLTEKVYEKPIVGQRKVYIINDCDKMTKEAQNSLLKTLEEPPEFAIILLITNNENAVLNTIKSRCMKINFNKIPNDILLDYAKNNLGFDSITNNMILAFDGSIGNCVNVKNNQELFTKIEQFVNKIVSSDKISIIKFGKVLYNKDQINDILDFFTVCCYSKIKEDLRFTYTIDYIAEANKHLKSNANFDMTIDTMLFGIAEIFDN